MKLQLKPLDSPSQVELEKVYPNVDFSSLGDLYAGESKQPNLIRLFVTAYQKHTLDEIDRINPDQIPANMRRGNARRFANIYLRFIKDNPTQVSLYYSFLNLFETDKLSDSEIYYAISFIQHYGNKSSRGLVNVLKVVRSYNVDYVDLDEGPDPTIEQIDNLYNVAKVIRAEGIVVDIGDLWVCSTHWKAQEILDLIADGMEVKKAVELYTLGITSMDEILDHQGTLPDSWIDRLLGRSSS